MRPGVMRHAKFTGEGRIEQIGTPLELYHQPRTRFVAGFLGAPAMNFIPAEVAGDLLRLPGGGLLMCPGMRQGKAELGVRPERIRVVGQPAQAHLQGTVTVLEPLGADTLVTVACTGHKVVARLPGDTPVRLSDRVLLAIDTQNLVLFDPDTGCR